MLLYKELSTKCAHKVRSKFILPDVQPSILKNLDLHHHKNTTSV